MVGDGARSEIAAEVDDIELGERRRADEFVEDDDADIEAGGAHYRKSSCVSECSLDDVDLEAGLVEIIKGSSDQEKAERNCRICHLSLESAAAESDPGITLSCSCKGDLSYSHKQCAETWFKIRGNNMKKEPHSQSYFVSKNQVTQELDIIVNGAATTNFYERYDVALDVNVMGVKHMCNFAKIVADNSSSSIEERVQEAVSNPFLVNDHCAEVCS